MCQISERFLLAKKVLENPSPGVGAHIQPGIKAFMDGEDLEDRREKQHGGGQRAGHQGIERFKSAQAGAQS